MTDEERDPALASLFAETRLNLAGDAFSRRVMSQIDKQKHRKVVVSIIVGLVCIPGVWLLTTTLQDAVQLLTQGLTLSLIDIENTWLALFLSPVNSAGALLAFGLIGLRSAYRKIIRPSL